MAIASTWVPTSLLARDRHSESPWKTLPLIKNGQVHPDWVHLGWGRFSVDGESLRTECEAKGLGLLVYRRARFGNCQIRVVYRTQDSHSNSGVYVRIGDGILKQLKTPGAAFVRDAAGQPSPETLALMKATSEREEGPWYAVHHGFEVQIADSGDAHHRTGSIYSLAQSKALTTKAPGEWKTLVITLAGTRIRVELDGQSLSDFDSAVPAATPRQQWYEPKREPRRPSTGYLGLQNHDPGDVVWFKEVSVRRLPRGSAL